MSRVWMRKETAVLYLAYFNQISRLWVVANDYAAWSAARKEYYIDLGEL